MAARYLDPPPRDFTKSRALTRVRIERAVRQGRARTAMRPFASILDDSEIEAVAAFVFDSFVRCTDPNGAYHTAANGWPDHELRNGAAFPFVRGEIPLDTPRADLTAPRRAGLELFRRTCAVCHEGVSGDAAVFGLPPTERGAHAARAHADSAPPERGEHDEYEEYGHGEGYDEANEHDRQPILPSLTAMQRMGQTLYQRACAQCHAADGTGRNWIGTFLDPSPPPFQEAGQGLRHNDAAMREIILDGRPNSSMPAFRGVLNRPQVGAIIAYVRRAFLDAGQ